MNPEPVVSARNVSMYNADDPYGKMNIKEIVRDGELVLSDVNIDIHAGEFVYLIGRVGSGKSTLLKTIYAEIPLMVGEGYVVGYNLKGLKQSKVPYLRRKLGIVFQDYNLFNDRNVFMNLHYVMKATGWRNENDIARELIRCLVWLTYKQRGIRCRMSFRVVSKRLVIARSLLNAPDLLLADEPTGNLDPVTSDEIMKLFQKIAQNGCAVIMSTHNTMLLESFPARALLLANGKIREVQLEND